MTRETVRVTEDREPRLRRFKNRDGSVTQVFWHPCCMCGRIDAGEGYGVGLPLPDGTKTVGTWYCHAPCRPPVDPEAPRPRHKTEAPPSRDVQQSLL